MLNLLSAYEESKVLERIHALQNLHVKKNHTYTDTFELEELLIKYKKHKHAELWITRGITVIDCTKENLKESA